MITFFICIALLVAAYFIYGSFIEKQFGIVWRYFGWANQTLAVFVLWTAAVYMKQTTGKFWFVVIPAVFMTAVVTSYILIAPEGFQLPQTISYILGIGTSIVFLGLFLFSPKTKKKTQSQTA